ncbi:unnamed protein product [Boreogadus saida]
MKRKKADIASFFRASGKKSAKAKNGKMEKKQAESEDEEPPESSNLNGPPVKGRSPTQVGTGDELIAHRCGRRGTTGAKWPLGGGSGPRSRTLRDTSRFPQRRFRQRERGASNNEWRPKWTTSRHFQIKNR